jgi:2',3'-cyclic-nucleotide 2'-phosphodiesterase
MNILMVGDIAGAPGRRLFCREATRMRATGEVDMVIANAENSAGGKGMTAAIAEELHAGGADVLTLGDHTWDQKDVGACLDRSARVVRPANFAPGCPGRGWTTVSIGATRVTVLNLVGRVFMNPVYDCPFRAADAVLAQETVGRVIVVDVHAEATSEKIVLGRYLDGRVSAVAGTHTHVQTSDETVLPGGTAYMTDLGMTGSKDSAIGRDLESVTRMFLTGMPAAFKVATGSVALEGALLDIDERTGRARGIRRVRIRE